MASRQVTQGKEDRRRVKHIDALLAKIVARSRSRSGRPMRIPSTPAEKTRLGRAQIALRNHQHRLDREMGRREPPDVDWRRWCGLFAASSQPAGDRAKREGDH
jgi:hypothetical protein